MALGAGGGGAPTDATYITQTANGSLSAEQALGDLSSGILRVAATSGVVTSLTDSAGLADNLSDETGTGAFVLATSSTLTTPTIAGVLTLQNGILYTDATMGALAIDTAELNNTKTVSADSTLTFSGAPGTGATFGLQLTNSDTAAHTITIPSSKSSALGGTARTTFVLAAGQTATIRWRHEGSSIYTMWGEPVRILDLSSATVATADSFEFYDATDGLSKRDTISSLASVIGSGSVEVQDETYSAANFNADTTHAVSQDDLYDLNLISDTDDDGLPDKVDLAAAGLVRTTAGGVISAAELSGEVTTSGSNAATIADSLSVTGWAMGASTATTPSADDNDTSLATTAYVQAEITAYATDTVSEQNKNLTNANNTLPAEVGIAASDETTALTSGTAKATFRMPYAMTVTAVRASLTTAQSAGSIFTVDINEGGTTIISTKLTVDNTEKTSTTAATAAVISDSALADDAEITIDIDQIGTSGATGLKVWLIGTR